MHCILLRYDRDSNAAANTNILEVAPDHDPSHVIKGLLSSKIVPRYDISENNYGQEDARQEWLIFKVRIQLQYKYNCPNDPVE